MKKLLTAFPILLLVLSSCQKEIDFNNPPPAGGNTPGGSSNGDLLVKALEITIRSKDTNTLTFQWDNSKRLLQYYSLGVVSGSKTYINHRISRATDGKINEIISRTEMSGIVYDSSVYTVHYLPNSTKMAYAIAKHITGFIDINDSTVYTYNNAGQISSKQTFSDLLGSWEAVSKEDYSYDANGNLTKILSYASDFSGGWLSGGVTTYTYGTYKSPMALGDESYIIIGPSATAKNNLVGMTTNAVASGSNYTGTYSQQQFNSYGRPTEEMLNILPQPPGYALKLVYYYQ